MGGSANDLSRTFTYNGAGQLKTRINATAAHAFSPAPANAAYAANGRNQYTTVAGASLGYDLNGNLTSTGSRTYGYDAENRLTSVSGGASLSLTYDPLGRLRSTTAGATTTDFLYEGDRLLAEFNGATVLRRYAHGPGVDEPVLWYEGDTLATKRWLHADERGSIVAWSDAAGAATVYRYGVYGEPAGGDFSGARFRYTGQIALPEVGLYHYKARAYDPALGRFLQTDPVGYQDDFNLYAYVYNDPLNRVDPNGLASKCPDRPNCWEADGPTANRPDVLPDADVEKFGTDTRSQVHSKNAAEAISSNEKLSGVVRNPDGSLKLERLSSDERGNLTQDAIKASGEPVPGLEMVSHGHDSDSTGSVAPGPLDDTTVNAGKPVGTEQKDRYAILGFKGGKFRYYFTAGAPSRGDQRTGQRNEIRDIGKQLDAFQQRLLELSK